MVGDYIDKHNGYLALSGEEYEKARANHSGIWKGARFLLKYGSSSEGCWNNVKFLVQVQQNKVSCIVSQYRFLRAAGI